MAVDRNRVRKLIGALALAAVVLTMGVGSAAASITPVGIVPASHTQGLASASAAAVSPANGDVFVTDPSSSAVLCFRSDGTLRWRAVGADYANALDIDADASGRPYVLLSNRTSLVRLNATTGDVDTYVTHNVNPGNSSGFCIRTLETTTYAFVIDRYAFGKKVYRIDVATGEWTFDLLTSMVDPKDVAVDATGRIWVTDAAQNKVLRINANGTVGTSLGTTGTAKGEFTGPEGIAVNADGDLLVADSTGRLQSLDPTLAPDGVQLATGAAPSDVGAFGRFTIAGGSDLVIADTANHRAQRRARVPVAGEPYFTYSTVVRDFGTSPSSANGGFWSPGALAPLAGGGVWVSDPGNDRIQELSAAGTYQGQVTCADPRGIATDGTYLFAVSADGYLRRYDAVTRLPLLPSPWAGAGVGAADGQLSDPQGIALDPAGNVYVADMGNNRVQKFLANGDWAASWTGFIAPRDVGVAANGHVYVLDAGGTRVQELGADGTVYETATGTLAGGTGGMWVSGPEHVFVADSSAGQLMLGFRQTETGQWWWDNRWPVTTTGTDASHVAEAADIAVQPFGAGAWVSDRALNRVFRCTFAGGGGYAHANASSGGWSNSAEETLTVVMGAPASGFSAIWTSLNGSEPTTMWAMTDGTHLGYRTFAVTAEGTTTLDVTMRDGMGNTSTSPFNGPVLIDRTPPTLELSGAPTGWVTHDVTVTATASDTPSGIASLTHQAYNGYFGDPYPMPCDVEPAVVATEFPTTIRFVAKDFAGNGATQTVLVRVDKTAPATNLFAGTIPAAPTTLTLSATDLSSTFPVVDGSGIAELWYRVDSGEATSAGAAATLIPFSAAGTYTVEHWAVDNVGHEGVHTTQQVVVPVSDGGGGGDVLDVRSFVVAGGASWVNTDTLSMGSDVTGATQMRFSGNGGLTWSDWVDYADVATVTVPNRPADSSSWGITAQYRAADLSTADWTYYVGLDTEAPVTSSSNIFDTLVWPSPADLSFIQGPSLSAAWPLCSIDGSPAVDATFGVRISTPGSHTVEWWCVDAAGNEETPHHTREIAVAAEKAATSLQLATPVATVSYPTVVTFTATLTAGDVPLPGKTVILERAASTGGPWLFMKGVSSDSGSYVATYTPSAHAYYRMVFVEDDTHLDAQSAVMRVSVKPYLTVPYAPSRAYLRRSITFYSYVKPRHTSGVVFKLYRGTSSSVYKTISAKYTTSGQPSTTSKAYNSYAFPYRGTWRIVAVHSDGSHSAVTTKPRYVTVK